MKYYGVVHGRTSDYNHEVRKLLGQLEARMHTTNQKYGVWYREIDDGVRARVEINFNGISPIYRALVERVAQREVELSIFMESGLCRGLGSGPAFGTNIYYTEELEADLASISPTIPSWLDWLFQGPINKSRVYVPGMDSLAIHDSDTLLDYAQFTNWGCQSGKSALLWQAQIGTRALPIGSYEGGLLP